MPSYFGEGQESISKLWTCLICFSCSYINFVVNGIFLSFGILIEPLSKRFQTSLSQLALTGSLQTGFYFLGGFVASGLINKHGCNKVSIAGGILGALVIAVSKFANSIAVFQLTFGLLLGFCISFSYTTANLAPGLYFTSKRAIACGVIGAGTSVGCIVIPYLTGISITRIGLDNTFWIYVALSLSIAAISFLIEPPTSKQDEVPDQPVLRRDSFYNGNVEGLRGKRASICLSSSNQDEGPGPVGLRRDSFFNGNIEGLEGKRPSICTSPDMGDNLEADPEDEEPSSTSSSNSWLAIMDFRLFKHLEFYLVAIGWFGVNAAFYTPYMFIVEMMKEQAIPVDLCHLVVPVMGATNLVGRLGVGFFVNHPRIDAVTTCIVAYTICAVICIFLPFCSSVTLFYILGGAYCFFNTPSTILVSIILVDLFGVDSLTSSYGLLTMFRGAGCLLGPPVAGYLIEASGSYLQAFILAGGLYGMATLCCLAIKLRIYFKRQQD